MLFAPEKLPEIPELKGMIQIAMHIQKNQKISSPIQDQFSSISVPLEMYLYICSVLSARNKIEIATYSQCSDNFS